MGVQVDSYPHAGFQQERLGAMMEYYTYVNIFATKGLEYLLLLAFLALFIFFLRYLSGPAEKGSPPPGKVSTTDAHCRDSLNRTKNGLRRNAMLKTRTARILHIWSYSTTKRVSARYVQINNPWRICPRTSHFHNRSGSDKALNCCHTMGDEGKSQRQPRDSR